MAEIRIYIAGPVLQRGTGHHTRDAAFALRFLYAQMEAEAKLAGVVIQLPYFEEELSRMGARSFAEEITRRIRKADAMLVVLFTDRYHEFPNYSIACEAQIGADNGKPLRFLATDKSEVPRLLQALAEGRESYTFDNVDFQKLFHDLSEQVKRREENG